MSDRGGPENCAVLIFAEDNGILRLKVLIDDELATMDPSGDNQHQIGKQWRYGSHAGNLSHDVVRINGHYGVDNFAFHYDLFAST
jgi:hypothetical protein